MQPTQQLETPVHPEGLVHGQDTALNWQASEYVHHEKDSTWFYVLIGGAIIMVILDVFVIKSWTFAVLIAVMAVGMLFYARRTPKILNYSLTSQSLQVDSKSFSLHDFRAFGVLREDAIYSAQLIPNKRFMPSVTLYFPEEYGESIVDMLGSVLPMETIEPDFIDRFMQQIRF